MVPGGRVFVWPVIQKVQRLVFISILFFISFFIFLLKSNFSYILINDLFFCVLSIYLMVRKIIKSQLLFKDYLIIR
jgi:hypothetical protein